MGSINNVLTRLQDISTLPTGADGNNPKTDMPETLTKTEDDIKERILEEAAAEKGTAEETTETAAEEEVVNKTASETELGTVTGKTPVAGNT